MFFFLSKTLDVLLLPLTWVVGALGLALALHRKKPRATPPLVGVALAVLLVGSSPWFANRCMRAIELPLLTTMKPDVVYDEVVVLGGVTDDRATELSGRPELNDASERLLVAFELLRTGKTRRLLLSGGSAPGWTRTEAALLADELTRLGADMSRVDLETESRNTRENAVYSKVALERLGAKQVLLVTSAFHMRRALGCFRAVGLDPDTLAVDVHAYDDARGAGLWPSVFALGATTVAIHELVGRWVYRARGYATKVD